jgi:hypothetical protein
MLDSRVLSVKQMRLARGLAGSHYLESINSILLTSFFYVLAAPPYLLIVVRHLRGSLGIEGCSSHAY